MVFRVGYVQVALTVHIHGHECMFLARAEGDVSYAAKRIGTCHRPCGEVLDTTISIASRVVVSGGLPMMMSAEQGLMPS